MIQSRLFLLFMTFTNAFVSTSCVCVCLYVSLYICVYVCVCACEEEHRDDLPRPWGLGDMGEILRNSPLCRAWNLAMEI